jgi:hypothetical protein
VFVVEQVDSLINWPFARVNGRSDKCDPDRARSKGTVDRNARGASQRGKSN